MTTTDQQQNQLLQDRFGRQVAARLSADTGLSHEVSERLRAARVRALARRKVVSSPTLGVSRGVATLDFDAGQPGLWGRLASALPLVALAAGLVAINVIQNENRAEEVAEVDAALLTDDLPPAAYADPGFMQFLNSGGDRAP
ncbi:MAG: DUF3619 family protein [Ramlibacter sp.]